MNLHQIQHYTLDDVAEIFKEKADAVLIIDAEHNCYKSVSRKGIFSDIIEEHGKYQDLIEKLWVNLSKNSQRIAKGYQVFSPMYGKFRGKYSRRLKLIYENTPHILQMTVYPKNDRYIYMLILDELDSSEYEEEFLTNEKVSNIQKTYLVLLSCAVKRKFSCCLI